MNQRRGKRRGLLLDYGGVMTTSVAESFSAFCKAEGLDIDAFWALLTEALSEPSSPFAQVAIGAIADEDFDRQVAHLLAVKCGIRVEPIDRKRRLFAGTQADGRMSSLVRAARDQGIATSLVSNSWGLSTYPRAL